MKLTLKDGTVYENVIREGNVFYTKTKIDKNALEKNSTPLVIEDNGTTSIIDAFSLNSFEEQDADNGEKLYIFSINILDIDEVNEESALKFIAENILTDDQALQVAYIFDDWNPNSVHYTKDVSKVRYKDELYKCLQSHTSQISWNPKDANSLWVRIDDPAEEWPEWRHPEGAHDAYAKGAKVTHNKKHWISDVDNNVWEPGVYGWTESPIETEETA